MIPEAVLGLSMMAIILPTFYLLGAASLKRVVNHDSMMNGLYFLAFGIGCWVYLLVCLGHLGLLTGKSVAVSLGIIYVLFGRNIQGFLNWVRNVWDYLFNPKGFENRMLQWLFLLICLIGLMGALMPEIAHDALSYQLHLSNQFVQNRSSVPIAEDLNSFLPLFMNHLYTLGVMMKSVPLAKLFHYICAIFLAISVMIMVDEQCYSKKLGMIVAALFLLTPTVMNEWTTTYVDIAASFFMTLFFYSLMQAEKEGEYWLSGIFLGFTISVKLLALIAVIPLALVIFFRTGFFQRPAKGLKRVLLFGFGSFLGGGFWFVRNLWVSGNPVYPYLGKWFGTQDFHYVSIFQEMGLAKNALNFVLTPLRMTFQPIHYDAGHWIGPVFLAMLPFALFAIVKEKRLRLYGVFVFGFYVVWYCLFHNARFLLQILPIYFLLGAWGCRFIFGLPKQVFLRNTAKTITGMMVLFLIMLSVYHYRYQFKAVVQGATKDQYLADMERSYPLAQWVNRELPREAKILNAGEIRQFYVSRQLVREDWFQMMNPEIYDYLGEQLIWQLREHGFTHVLRSYETRREVGYQMPRRLFKLDGALQNSPEVLKLADIPSKNIREKRVVYQIYQL